MATSNCGGPRAYRSVSDLPTGSARRPDQALKPSIGDTALHSKPLSDTTTIGNGALRVRHCRRMPQAKISQNGASAALKKHAKRTYSSSQPRSQHAIISAPQPHELFKVESTAGIRKSMHKGVELIYISRQLLPCCRVIKSISVSNRVPTFHNTFQIIPPGT